MNSLPFPTDEQDDSHHISDDQEQQSTDPVQRVRELKKSRSKWNVRAKTHARNVKRLDIKTRDLSNSRENWKQRAMKAEAEVKRLQRLIEVPYPGQEAESGLKKKK